MPSIGRNPIYIGGLALFVIFQAPIVAAPNFATILVFRFLSGFVGSPALATGGASMAGELGIRFSTQRLPMHRLTNMSARSAADIFPFSALPVAIGVWSLGAVCGPVLGPVVGGFAAEANGWRWPNYELLWISGFSLLLLGLCLPETLGSTILVRRAARLRKLTGNPLLKTQYELDRREDETAFQLAKYNFIRAIQLCAEPAVLFANSYIALVYAIFYLCELALLYTALVVGVPDISSSDLIQGLSLSRSSSTRSTTSALALPACLTFHSLSVAPSPSPSTSCTKNIT